MNKDMILNLNATGIHSAHDLLEIYMVFRDNS